MMNVIPASLAKICDHTFLTPVEAFRGQGNAIELRREAFMVFLAGIVALPEMPYSICVPVGDITHVQGFLQAKELKAKIVSIAGFPDGSWISTTQKVTEALTAMALGADEVDMVLHWRALKAGDLSLIKQELSTVVAAVHGEGGLLKVILEGAELTEEETKVACDICNEVGVDFVKSNTGFGRSGATPEIVARMARFFPGGIKMSGGITQDNIEELLAATGMEPPFDPMKLRIGESRLLG